MGPWLAPKAVFPIIKRNRNNAALGQTNKTEIEEGRNILTPTYLMEGITVF